VFVLTRKGKEEEREKREMRGGGAGVGRRDGGTWRDRRLGLGFISGFKERRARV